LKNAFIYTPPLLFHFLVLFIPERFTLVKLEGYCRVYGPQTVYSFPRDTSPVVIGQNFPVEIGRFPDFKLFFSDSPHPTTCLGWKSTQQGFSVDFVYFFLNEIQISLVKGGLWLVDIRFENCGTLLCRGIRFFGWNIAKVRFPM
jgi:hypothetical protein